MRKYIEEHEQEVLLILITMLGITRWWIPPVSGFPNLYPASHWVLSYDHGLVRRGLIGAIVNVWMPIVSIENVHHIALVVYCTLLAVLLILFYALVKYKDKEGRLFRLILFFCATPATLSLFAQDLGRFDLFLTFITLLSLTILSIKKHIWLIPVSMTVAMFIHESFLILYAPTIVAAIIFIYLWDRKEKKILATLAFSVMLVVSAFYILYKFGNPALGYEEFMRFVQSRATFSITDLSMRECYYSVNDHVHLASSSLYDVGSIVNFFMALLILSPAIIILCNLWTHALRNSGSHQWACRLFILATLSGLILVPIATDYGRWLSAIISCNFFAIFFLVSIDIIKVDELTEYTGGSFPLLFMLILFTYLLFGPLHDWNPYPYRDNIIYSSLSIIAVLLFDIGFYLRWRSLSRVRYSGESTAMAKSD